MSNCGATTSKRKRSSRPQVALAADGQHVGDACRADWPPIAGRAGGFRPAADRPRCIPIRCRPDAATPAGMCSSSDHAAGHAGAGIGNRDRQVHLVADQDALGAGGLDDQLRLGGDGPRGRRRRRNGRWPRCRSRPRRSAQAATGPTIVRPGLKVAQASRPVRRAGRGPPAACVSSSRVPRGI